MAAFIRALRMAPVAIVGRQVAIDRVMALLAGGLLLLALLDSYQAVRSASFVVDPALSRNAVGILHIHDCLRAGIV